MQTTQEHFARHLEKPMVRAEWAADMARRLLAYDPMAAEFAGVEFEQPGDRIVVLYRTKGRSRRKRSFIVHGWKAPQEA